MTVICHGAVSISGTEEEIIKLLFEQTFLAKAIVSAQFQIFSKKQKVSV